MTAVLHRRITVSEFLAWAETRSEGRFELVDGRIVAMAPERLGHVRAKMAVWLALSEAIRATGVPCEAFGDGATIRINDHNAREPDASVQCGGDIDPREMVLERPLIVAEVLSPSSERDDLGRKLHDYFSLASIQHYLIVDAERRTVVHHRRGAEGGTAAQTHSDGRILLDPPGIEVVVTDLFARP